ncbi:MAG: hypothetical protein INR70_05040 [Parafilimonas terrae]|nr:hypothetical protein [Parafilimonas terrae]
MSLDRVLLCEVGQFLYGDEWRRRLARDLGPLHPAGARDSIDHRLPARWAAGQKPIPAWVGPALKRLLAEREASLLALADRIGIAGEDE